jgi:hypothetical protein
MLGSTLDQGSNGASLIFVQHILLLGYELLGKAFDLRVE